MIRPLECFIGLRYLATGRGRGLVSFMSAASLAGITLGVSAIIVILSAMNGLEAESRNRLLSMSEHITLRVDGEGAGSLASARTLLANADGVAAVTPFVQFEAVLVVRNEASFRSVNLRGIDPVAEQGSDLETIVGPGRLGELEPGSDRILLGRFVASELNVQPGDRLEVWLPQADGGRVNFRTAAATVSGVFVAGVEQHDSNLALMHLADADRLAGVGDTAEALGIRLAEPMTVGRVEQALRATLGPGYSWSNWATENASLFQAMAIEKTMMTILMMFIVAVAAFNIVTSLTMVVNEKEKDIAILRTLGLEPQRVTRVFLVQGAIIGIGGTLAGVLIGLVLAFNLETILPWIEQVFGFRIMPGDVFYVTEVPSEIRLQDLLLVPGFALLIALVATIVPSRKAARIDPADVLRYE
jgi:lipoprotein-releasing system permease protein